MTRIVGIDLGTTNSLVAYMEGSEPKVIPDLDGHRLVPSVISFTPSGIVVGEKARVLRGENAERTVYSVKRLMGRGVEEVSEELRYIPFRLSNRSHEVVRLTIGGKDYTPPELSAYVLRQLKEQAEAALGEEVRQAVITVPAYFNDSQRQATKDAGRIAGLEVLRIVNEPTAASLAYGLHKRKQGVIAVYDLGGGTFDISILKLSEGIFEVLSTNGNTHLGGDDFDRALMEHVLKEISERGDALSKRDPTLFEKIRAAAEKAKCDLSFQESAEMAIPRPDGTVSKRVMSRGELEEVIKDLVLTTVPCCRQAMADAGLSPAQIDEVILVGGSTRIPLVRRAVQDVFQKEPHCELNPDEVVALGAAVQAGILAGGVKDMLLLDVTPLSLGIETFGGLMSKLIERNTTVPTAAEEDFTTFVDGQTTVDIHVLQGERDLVKDNRSLARFQLKGIEPLPAGMPRVRVRFQIDADGILNVSAKDLRRGKEQSIEVKPTYGLTEAEVEGMIRDSMVHARGDIAERMLIETRNEAVTILRSTEKALLQAQGRLAEDEVREIKKAMVELQQVVESGDRMLIRQKIDQINAVTGHLAEILMDSALKEALQKKKITEVI